ncbi:MAG: hypothetical protein ACXW5U_05015 [Thermoanaerobaculia bacterium]
MAIDLKSNGIALWECARVAAELESASGSRDTADRGFDALNAFISGRPA